MRSEAQSSIYLTGQVMRIFDENLHFVGKGIVKKVLNNGMTYLVRFGPEVVFIRPYFLVEPEGVVPDPMMVEHLRSFKMLSSEPLS